MFRKILLTGATVFCVASGAVEPAASRPLMIQRFSVDEINPGIWEKMLPELEKYRACADEVWFSNGTFFPSLEGHARRAERMAKCAADLRKIGIVPSLQIQETVGHGDRFSAPENMAGKNWGSYVGKNGEVCRISNCPRQTGFLEYLDKMSRLYAAWKPGSVWIDDDLRLANHAPANEYGGCYCETCLKLFSEKEGRAYTREELIKACKTDPALEKRWLAFGEESLCLVAATIAKAFHEVSPDTRLALQHTKIPERNAILRTLQQVSGHRSASRPGGSAYSDHNPYAFLHKSMTISKQVTEQVGYDVVDQICAEIEDFPRDFTCKTAQGLNLESLLYLSSGADSLSYYAVNPFLETPDWYGENIFAPLAKNAPFYRDYIAFAAGTHPAGVGVAREYDYWKNVEVLAVGLPIAGYRRDAMVRIVTEEVVNALSEEELVAELTGVSVLLDGAAVDALGKKGLSHLVGGVAAQPLPQAEEYYTDDPLNKDLAVDRHGSYCAPAFKFTVPPETKARILGEYRQPEKAPATVLIAREDGTFIGLLGAGGFEWIVISSTRVPFLYNLLDEMAKHQLPALPVRPVQCNVIPRVDEKGALRCVTIANATIGVQPPFEMLLRNVPENASAAEWVTAENEPVKCELRRANGETRVTIPAIGAWRIGFLKVK
ncbi:MAG: hypothetical protein MJ016_00475 [Victivallaceae bacterium]|nr:hypothetical protein [Victivallaceae bacterium]